MAKKPPRTPLRAAKAAVVAKRPARAVRSVRLAGRSQGRAADPIPAGPAGASRGTDWDQVFSQADVFEQWDRYFELFNLAPVGYVLSDLRGVVQEVNQAAAHLLGRPLSSLVGRPLAACVAVPDRAAFLNHMRRVWATEAIVEADLSLLRRDGSLLTAHLSTRRSPRFDLRPLCWTVIVDVGERQRLEEARRLADHHRDRAERDEVVARTRSEAKDRFIATLSHELRNPLAPALYAASHLAELPDLPPTAVRFVDMIRRNIEFEARLIEDLLDVTRIDKGKISLTLATVDVHAVLAEVVAAAQIPAQTRTLSVQFEPRARRAFVTGDQTRLRQVAWNLVSNALKFTPPGGRIAVATTNDEHGWVRLSVTDTGIGIDPANLGSLFVPFEQVGRPRHGGLGLGLAISRGIVNAHDGRMWVTSRGLDEGATFEVELPTVDGPPSAAASVTSPSAGLASRVRRILVVEDHEDSAEMLRLALETAGHHVDTAGSLRDALPRLAESWDLVVSDLGLPDGSGLDLARHARALPHPPGKLVALSGFGSDADREACHRAGFDVHLIKPVLPSKILELLT